MYQPTYYHRQKKTGSYFLPFVSLIILGLIVVFAFQIVDYFRQKQLQALENKAAIKVASGRAEMKIWGVEQWTNAVDGSILNEGDAIRTSPGSRVVLSLLNGSTARLSSETEVELTSLKSQDYQDEASFSLKKGELWVKKSEKEGVKVALKVETPHLEVDSIGTVFDVTFDKNESVHVLDGKVRAIIRVEEPDGKMRIADSLDVGLGQEVSIGEADVNEMKNRRPVDLLAVLSDEFRASEWYVWNRNEDLTGQSAVAVADAVNQQQQTITVPEKLPEVSGSPVPEITPAVQEITQEVTSVLCAPEIISPKETERTSKVGTFMVSGKVCNSTQKVEVATTINGKQEAYFLQKYKPGSESWNYTASWEYRNLMPGENKIMITAIDKDGKRSDPANLTLVYDKPKEPADLSAPTVSAFNGSESSEVEVDSILVTGKIGKGIAKVWINDFLLSQYVMDSGKWSYYAKTVYGNLKDGENEYSIYGMDLDGNKTPVTKFNITKKAAPVVVPEVIAPPVPEVPAVPTENPAPVPAPKKTEPTATPQI